MNHPAIQINNLSLSYGKGPNVLHDISLSVNCGEFVSIIGRSGCGKTTLLNCIAGFLPYHGEVRLEGRIGVCFQDHACFPWMTVAQNIGFGVHERAARREVVADLLSRIGMQADAGKFPAQLSGGQAQRVGLARALASKPDILLMDEPYGALDRETRDRMQEWLLSMLESTGQTVVFVTHDIEEAVFLSNRVAIMDAGIINSTLDIPLARPRLEETKFTSHFNDIKRMALSEFRQNAKRDLQST